MVVFESTSVNTKLNDGVKLFNDLLIKGVVQKALRNQPEEKFDYSNITRSQIADFIDAHMNDFKCEVNLYKAPFWSKALATTYTGNFNYIGINSRKANRSVESLAGSVAHEWGHCLEYFCKGASNHKIFFNHGDNSPIGKENTFQYWLGTFVKKWLEDISA